MFKRNERELKEKMRVVVWAMRHKSVLDKNLHRLFLVLEFPFGLKKLTDKKTFIIAYFLIPSSNIQKKEQIKKKE